MESSAKVPAGARHAITVRRAGGPAALIEIGGLWLLTGPYRLRRGPVPRFIGKGQGLNGRDRLPRSATVLPGRAAGSQQGHQKEQLQLWI